MRKIKKGILYLLFVFGCTDVDSNFRRLLKSPDKFQGQDIEISGFYREEVEGVAIYLDDSFDKRKGVWLNFSMFFSLNTLTGYDGAKVKVRGTFNVNDKGHLDQYFGSLDNAKIFLGNDNVKPDDPEVELNKRL